jgi:hypothetical protein
LRFRRGTDTLNGDQLDIMMSRHSAEEIREIEDILTRRAERRRTAYVSMRLKT